MDDGAEHREPTHPSRRIVANTSSRSSDLLTVTGFNPSLSVAADDCIARSRPECAGWGGFHNTATRVISGLTSLRSSSHFAVSSVTMLTTPVMLPPGLA